MLALDPKATWEYVLVGDREKASPPTFVLRYVSFREYRACLSLHRKADAAKAASDADGDALMDEALRLVKAALVDIRNAPDPWRLDDLEAALTLRELWELFYAVASGGRIAEGDRKNLPLPARGAGESSAPDAPATPASAGTSPTPPSPLSCTTGGSIG